MGILKSREEMIPVTCAVLKEQDREHFFADARKKVGGNMDRVAAICGVPVSTVADWVNGTINIPYHALQRLAQELQIEQPQVSELRREFQSVSQMPQTRRQEAAEPPPSRSEARRELKKLTEGERPPRRQRPERGERSKRPPKAAKPPRPEKARREPRRERPQPKQQAPRPPKPGGAPKLSDRLAYWAGALFAAARRGETTVVLTADRRIGQNFAGSWANLTADLLGTKPSLSMSEDRKSQSAELPCAGLEDFLNRLEFKPGAEPAQAPGAPRWAWSNPEWKKAFLRGVVDATARFSREPSLAVAGLSPRLRQSALKILASLGLAPKDGPEGAVLLEGADVEKYFDAVGTQNMKIRDQFKAFRAGAAAPDEDADPGPEQPGEDASPVSQTEVEPPLVEASTDPAVGAEEPPAAPSASSPAAKPAKPGGSRRRRSRRTAFRGKPGA